MIQLTISPNDSGLGDLIAALEMVSTKKLPNTVRAIKVAVATMEYTWKAYAMGAPIPGSSVRVKSVRGEYAKSIHSKSQNLSGVIFSDSPYAASIEDDQEAKDLKKIIPFGPKSRMGRNGPYSIVPFRHGVPGSLGAPMPDTVYRAILAKINSGEFQKSKVRRKTIETPNAAGVPVKRHTYKWGNRTKKTGFPNLEGMVVFNVPSGGAEKRSEYVTFRIITANKPKVSKSQKGWENSWVVPARRGLHLTRYVVANTKDIVAQIIKSGIEMDVLP